MPVNFMPPPAPGGMAYAPVIGPNSIPGLSQASLLGGGGGQGGGQPGAAAAGAGGADPGLIRLAQAMIAARMRPKIINSGNPGAPMSQGTGAADAASTGAGGQAPGMLPVA